MHERIFNSNFRQNENIFIRFRTREHTIYCEIFIIFLLLMDLRLGSKIACKRDNKINNAIRLLIYIIRHEIQKE